MVAAKGKIEIAERIWNGNVRIGQNGRQSLH